MSTLIKRVLHHKKPVIIIILILTGIIYSFFRMGVLGNSNVSYKTITVARGNLSTVINASGQLEPENSAVLSFLTSGRLLYLNFKEGDTVTKGQVIASLDTTQSREAVSKAEASYKSAQSALAEVIDDIHLYQYGNGGFGAIGSANETQAQKTDREQAEMVRDAAYQDLQSARKNLEWSTIIAPFDGVISGIKGMNVGQNMSALSPGTVSMVGSSGLKFVANVDEIDFHRLTLGVVGEIILDAFPDETFAGQITKIGIAATKLSTGGSTVEVDFSIAQDSKFKSGLNGEVNVTVTTKTGVIALPRSAIRKDNGDRYVYLSVDKKAQKVTVKAGETLGSQTEVTEGLKEGDLVILGDVTK